MSTFRVLRVRLKPDAIQSDVLVREVPPRLTRPAGSSRLTSPTRPYPPLLDADPPRPFLPDPARPGQARGVRARLLLQQLGRHRPAVDRQADVMADAAQLDELR